MKRAAKIAAGIAALLPVLGIAGLLSSRQICACGDAEMFWAGKLRVSPVTGDPQMVRARILEQLPPGSSVEQVMEFIREASQSPSLHRRCTQARREIACHYPVMTEWFGLKKRGFFVGFALDENGRVADAHVRGYVLWFREPV